MSSSLPVLDAPRRRLRLAPVHLAVLRGLLDQPGPVAVDGPPEDLARAEQELQQAGVLLGEHVHPLALDLLRTLLLPTLQLAVEVVGPDGASLADVVVSGLDVWSTDPWPGQGPDDAVVWTRSELPSLLWELSRLVGLRSAPVPADAAPLHADLASVDGVLSVLLGADPDRPLPALTTVLAQSEQVLGHLPAADRVRWTALLASWQGSWRVSVAWGDRQRSLSVLDAGPEGYWRREEPRDPLADDALDPAAPVLLHPVGPEQLWRDLGALLPSSAELRAAA